MKKVFLYTFLSCTNLITAQDEFNELTPEFIYDYSASSDEELLKNYSPLNITKNVFFSNNEEDFIIHITKNAETKFGFIRKYGILPEELERDNPHIKNMLMIGHRVKVRKSLIRNPDYLTTSMFPKRYRVKQGETKAILANRFNIDIQEFDRINPKLEGREVLVGQIIVTPDFASNMYSKSLNSNISKINKTIVDKNFFTKNNSDSEFKNKLQKTTYKDFSKTISKNANGKILIIEASESKIDNYSKEYFEGFQIAIDSIKSLNSNLNIVSKKFNSVKEIKDYIQKNKPTAIIGGFNEFEEFIPENVTYFNISKKTIKPNNNKIFNINTDETESKRLILNLIRKKNGNIIVVSDLDKTQDKELISQILPNAKFVSMKSKTQVDKNSFINSLNKDEKNYIIINSTNTSLFLATTNLIFNSIPEYKTQLIFLNDIDTIDEKYVAHKRFNVLDMIYPKARNIDKNTTLFNKMFIKKFNSNPTEFNYQGFDIAFDIFTRFSQNESFESTLKEPSQHTILNFKFEQDNNQGAYYNRPYKVIHYNTKSEIVE